MLGRKRGGLELLHSPARLLRLSRRPGLVGPGQGRWSSLRHSPGRPTPECLQCLPASGELKAGSSVRVEAKPVLHSVVIPKEQWGLASPSAELFMLGQQTIHFALYPCRLPLVLQILRLRTAPLQQTSIRETVPCKQLLHLLCATFYPVRMSMISTLHAGKPIIWAPHCRDFQVLIAAHSGGDGAARAGAAGSWPFTCLFPPCSTCCLQLIHSPELQRAT